MHIIKYIKNKENDFLHFGISCDLHWKHFLEARVLV